MAGVWLLLIGSAAMMAVVYSTPIDNTTQNCIEIRVFVDRHAFKSWKDKVATSSTWLQRVNETKAAITDYVYSVFNDVNSIFKELMRYGINLDVRVHSIHFVKQKLLARGINKTTGQLSPGWALYLLSEWVNPNYPAIDHNMLFTGLTLKKKPTQNYPESAYYGSTCFSDPFSVVEATTSGAAALFMAHQLGLSMTVEAEGSHIFCDNGYIMSAFKTHSSPTNFRFSECSIKRIKRYLEVVRDRKNCLTAANTNTPPVSAPALGERYTPDDICKMTFGNSSYFCRSLYGYGGHYSYDSMCGVIYCKQDSGLCTQVRASDGFVCGKDKQCYLGECKSSLSSDSGSSPGSAPAETCPQGDSPVANDEGQTCSQAVLASPRKCYNGEFQRACCDSCHRAATNLTGCQYGDMASECSDFSRPQECNRDHDVLCCEFCRPYYTGIAGCEYGDKDSDCPHYIATGTYSCERRRQSCCKTCENYTSTATEDVN